MNESFPLRELTIEITKQCPMKCIICSSEAGNKDIDELSLSELKRIVDDAKVLGLKTVILSGGEPLECSNTIDFIRHIKQKGLELNLYSCGNLSKGLNGIGPLPNSLLKDLKELNVDKIIFSIHGPDPEVHDAITSKKGSFSNLVTSIKRAKKAGHQIELHFVPTLKNYLTLSKVVQLVKDLKINRISILRFVPQGRGLTNRDSLEIKDDNILELKCILDRILKDPYIEIRLGTPFNCFHLDCQSNCSAGITKATIRPDGLVVPCVSMKRVGFSNSLDDIHSTTIETIWKTSKLFDYIRKYHKKIGLSRCNSCDYYHICKGGCLTQRLIRTDSIDGVDSYCLMKGNPCKGTNKEKGKKGVILIDST
jgi:radical SAM protein with 4Fe4S-binding SPASM domain